MNFGTIKDIYASVLVESKLSNDDKGKTLYKKFIKLLGENEILKSQFIVYKNIENRSFVSESSASDYLKENISVLSKYSKKEITRENKKLVKLLEDNGYNLENTEERELHKGIHSLISEKKTAVNINKLHESFGMVRDWLLVDKDSKETKEYVRENIDPQKFLEIAVNDYNEKYGTLTEEEKDIIKVLRKGEESSINDLVNKLVKENIELINEHLKKYGNNLEMKEKLLSTKDVVYGMVDNNKNSFNENVLELLELKKGLNA